MNVQRMGTVSRRPPKIGDLRKDCDPSDMAHQHIFGRIQEMCTPIRFDGGNLRAVAAEAKLKAARSILGVAK